MRKIGPFLYVMTCVMCEQIGTASLIIKEVNLDVIFQEHQRISSITM